MTAAPGPQQPDEVRPVWPDDREWVPDDEVTCMYCQRYKNRKVCRCGDPNPLVRPAAPSAQPDVVHTCWHPFGCQAPGDGCHGPCPVTPGEGRRIESDLARDLCSCGHGLLLHDGGEDCTMPTCPCTWFYEGRPDWDDATPAQPDEAQHERFGGSCMDCGGIKWPCPTEVRRVEQRSAQPVRDTEEGRR